MAEGYMKSPPYLIQSALKDRPTQRTWLFVIISLGAGMLLFMMIPALTPLNAGIMNVILTFAGGTVFASGLGAVSTVVLSKTSLV